MCDENNRDHYEEISRELSSRIDQRINGLRRPRRQTNRVIMALCLMVCILGMMIVVGNPSIAENIPVVKELMHYFNRDKGVQYAEDHGYELAEVTAISDGYRAYMKDVVLDGERMRGKLAVVDSEGSLLEGYSHLFIESDEVTDITVGTIMNLPRGGKDPWYDFNESITDPFMEVCDLVIVLGEKTIVFKDMVHQAINKCQVTESKRYRVNEKYEAPFGHILVNYIELTPVSTKVNYSIKGKEGYSMPWISNNSLRLSQGQDYYTKPRAIMNDDRSETIEYEGSFYYEPLPLKLEFCINSFRTYELMKNVTIELKNGGLEDQIILDDEFTISDVEYLEKKGPSNQSGTYQLGIDCRVPTVHIEFPIPVLKNRYSEWARGYKTEDYSSETVSFSKKECEEVIGTKLEQLLELEDKAFDVAALPFFLYYRDKIGKSFDPDISEEEKLLRLYESREYLIEVLKSISNKGILYTSWDKEILVTELTYEFTNMNPDQETIELGILGDMTMDENIVIPIILEGKTLTKKY